MSEAAVTANNPRGIGPEAWYTRKCPNEACGTMNHVRRNACMSCGTALEKKPKKPKHYEVGPTRGAKNIITPAQKRKIKAKNAAQGESPESPATLPEARADESPILTDIEKAEAVFALPAAPPPDLRPHVAIRRFSTVVRGFTMTFDQFKVIEDQAMIRVLLDEKAPIVPADDADGFACCPRCQNVFQVAKPSIRR